MTAIDPSAACQQMASLKDKGRDRAQDYLIGRPMPADEFKARVRARGSA